jgi:thiol-disulfide isomerase/thioredoxin
MTPASDPSLHRRALLAALATLALPARAAQVSAWPAGKPAPALRLADLDGRTWDLAALRGQPVVLNFWASWCEPCREEMPSLELMAERHRADKLQVLTINYQEGERAIRGFLDRQPMDLPVLLDRDGQTTATWTPRLFPSSVLVAADGRPQRRVLGATDWGSAEARGWLRALIHPARRQ